MKAYRPDPETITLIPKDQESLRLGVTAAPQDGMLHAVLTVVDGTVGEFNIMLTAQDLGMLAVVSKTLLTLNANQVEALRNEGNQP